MTLYKIAPRQGIFEVALQATGSLEGLKEILVANEGLDFSQPLDNGQIIKVPKVVDPTVVNYFTGKTIVNG